MKMQLFSVYDSKTKTYAQPNFLINKGAALRAWEEAANDKSMQIGKTPADFTLFHIGEFDDETGVITMANVKESLGCAIEFTKIKEN